MNQSHFQIQLYARTPESAVAWRLLSANNRESGRSAVTHVDAETCRIAIKELQRDLPTLERRVFRALEPNRWTWELRMADGPVLVTSSHGFDRMVRCERAAGKFVEEFALAPINAVVLYTDARRWGSRTSVAGRSESRRG